MIRLLHNCNDRRMWHVQHLRKDEFCMMHRQLSEGLPLSEKPLTWLSRGDHPMRRGAIRAETFEDLAKSFPRTGGQSANTSSQEGQ